jgi:hypothetical protein
MWRPHDRRVEVAGKMLVIGLPRAVIVQKMPVDIDQAVKYISLGSQYIL